MKHTQPPYYIEEKYATRCGLAGWYVRSEEYCLSAVAFCSAKANAEFIAKACNAADADRLAGDRLHEVPMSDAVARGQ